MCITYNLETHIELDFDELRFESKEKKEMHQSWGSALAPLLG